MAADDLSAVTGEDARGILARARAGIHTWISRAGRGLLHATPAAIMTAMTAAALAPLLVPLIAGGAAGAEVIGQILAQLGNVGSGYISESIQDVVRRLRGEAAVTTVSEDTVRNVLERRLEADWAGSHASGLRAEMAGVLKAVNGIATSLEAAFGSEVQGLAAHIGQAVGQMSETVTEFAGLREDVLAALASIQADVARTQSLQENTLWYARDASSKLDRVSVEIVLLRRSLRQGPFSASQPAGADTGTETTDGELPDVHPYPGLAPFGETDEFWFHGRERLTASLATRLRERLRGSSPMLVVGASGAGKSSLLNAGLIPELRDGRFAPGCGDWPCFPMTPGTFPLRELAVRLAMLAELPTSVVLENIETDPGWTPLIVRQALLTRDERRRRGVQAGAGAGIGAHDLKGISGSRRLILIIDQFEEVFTQCEGQERIKFIEAICAMASGSVADPPPALVVICLRAGFVEECTAHPPLEPALQDQFIVGPMRASELTAAIEEPARDAGLTVDGGLAATMLSDLGAVTSPVTPDSATYDPGALPLLAHALRETWERREHGRMTLSAYHTAGGIKEAIGRKADDVYDSLDDTGKQVARELLGHMISVRADAEDTRRRLSRPALLAELPTAYADRAVQVLDLLEAHRLVTSDGESVQIAHEALLRHWPRLSGWLAENRAWLRHRQRLTEQAREWDEGSRHPDRLLRGVQLSDITEELTTARSASLGDLETTFLRLSQRRRARAHRTRLEFMSILTAAVVVASGFAIAAQRSSRAARDQQAIAQSQQLAARAQTLADSDPGTSLALSLEAYRRQQTTAAVSSLLTAQSSYFHPLRSPAGPVSAVAYDPKRHLLASASNAVVLWNTDTNKPTATLTGQSPFYDVAFAPSGLWLAGAEENGDTVIWNMHRVVRNLHRRAVATLRAPDSTSTDTVAFSHNGQMLATAGYDGEVTLWRTGTFRKFRTIHVGGGPVWSIAFSSDDSQLAAACSDHIVRVWNTARLGSVPVMLTGPATPVRSVAFSPRSWSPLLAAGDDSGTIRLWNPRTRKLRAILSKGSGPVLSLAFTPDGSQLASGSGGRGGAAVRLWNITSDTLTPLTGPANDVSGVAFSPDSQMLASADEDGTVGLWKIPPLPPPAPPIPAVAATPLRGGIIATTAAGQIDIWNLDKPSRLLNPPARLAGTLKPGAAEPSIAFGSGGQWLAAPARSGGIDVWSGPHQARADDLNPPKDPRQISSVAFRPGKPLVVAAGSVNDYIYLWTVPTGKLLMTFSGQQQGPVTALAFSQDGSLLAAGGADGTIVVGCVSLKGGIAHVTCIQQVTGGFGPIEALTFSPQPNTLASASADGTVKLWHVSSRGTLTGTATLPGPTQPVVSVAFSSDGTMLAASAADRTISLWNTPKYRSPSLFATITGLAAATGVAFVPGTHIIAGAASDGTAQFWNTNPDQVAEGICKTAPPALTRARAGIGAAFQPVCLHG